MPRSSAPDLRLRALARRHGLDALGVLGALVYALPSLFYPFGMDQPVHWYIGRRWLEGLVPYATGVSTKPPGVFAIHAASILALGSHPWVVRVVDLVFVLVAGALVASFRARDGDGHGAPPRRPGELGAATLAVAALTYTFFDWNALGHPDLWQGALMLLSGWLVVRAPGGAPSLRRALAAGAAVGAAITLKHVAVVSGAFGLVAVALAYRRGGAAAAARVGAAFAAGLALVVALAILPFALTGTLGPLREVMVDWIASYAETATAVTPSERSWPTYERGLLPLLAAAGMALGGLLIATRDRDRPARAAGAMALLALGCGAGAALFQLRARLPTFSYLWLTAVPALALGIAFGLRQALARRGGAQLAVVVALGAIAFVAEPEWLSTPRHSYRREWAMRVAVLRGALPAIELERRYVGPQPMVDSHPWQRDAAEWIRARARPGDTLCVDGFFASIHHMTGLDCPSRFFVPPHAQQGALPGWHDEHAAMFAERPPTFFVTVSNREATIAARRAQGYVLHEVTRPMRFRLVVLERR
ncbi:MAG: hypothetical protein KF729_22495 [Sandaracinaceae bacterium]|nr:hypothetical protein [Sandaracinaceae bacterium]